jgi:hypothetical protein
MATISRITALPVTTFMLLAPALWNGFPLLQYDTGGYFARWYEGTLEESRSTVYGLFLYLLARPDFWAAAVIQAAVAVWVVARVIRVHGFDDRVLVTTVGVLALLTALPWLAGQLITDIFTGGGVLALYLIMLRADVLARWERAALIGIVAFAAATHSATFAVLAGLVIAGLPFALYDRKLVRFSGVGRGIAALVLGAALLLASNYALVRRIAWTPGGIALMFGRMLNEGLAKRYLVEHCPDPRFQLCDHIAELPDDADVFFWGEGIFDKLGRFKGLNDEMRTIVLESVAAYPWEQFKGAVRGTLEQLVEVATGYGVNTEIWHTYGMIENFAPSAVPAMKTARQQQSELNFTAINRLHVPVAWASMVLLLGVIVLGARRARFADLSGLAAVVTLAILGNAFVCGALSNPHDRYGARIVWLATFVLLLVPWRAATTPAIDKNQSN